MALHSLRLLPNLFGPVAFGSLGPVAMGMAAVLLLIAVQPAHGQGTEEAAPSRIPELAQMLGDYRQKQSNALAEFNTQHENLRQKYRQALESAAQSASQKGDLDTVVAIRREIALLESPGVKELADPPAPAVEKLRGIYSEQRLKIQAAEDKAAAPLLEEVLRSLTGLEGDLTRAQRIEDALAVRAVRQEMENNRPSPSKLAEAPSVERSISSAAMGRRREEGGRLRVSGNFLPGLSAVLPIVEQIPPDVVSVHAYRTAWMARRKNGSAVIVALNADRSEAKVETGLKPEMWVEGHDPWIHTKDAKSPHRLVNWELNRGPFRFRNPIALAAGHACALMFNARGEAQIFGGTSPLTNTPPESMLKGAVRAYSSKLVFMLVDGEGRFHLWHFTEGRPVEHSLPESVRADKVAGGEGHFLIIDREGALHPLDCGSTAVSPDFQAPTDLGQVLEVRAGGRSSAAQLSDGSWRAWGPDCFARGEVAKAGAALDLGLYFGEGSDYAIWIEPVN
jgi:hypothetical protein